MDMNKKNTKRWMGIGIVMPEKISNLVGFYESLFR